MQVGGDILVLQTSDSRGKTILLSEEKIGSGMSKCRRESFLDSAECQALFEALKLFILYRPISANDRLC